MIENLFQYPTVRSDVCFAEIVRVPRHPVGYIGCHFRLQDNVAKHVRCYTTSIENRAVKYSFELVYVLADAAGIRSLALESISRIS
jgi:hypothetical protein